MQGRFTEARLFLQVCESQPVLGFFGQQIQNNTRTLEGLIGASLTCCDGPRFACRHFFSCADILQLFRLTIISSDYRNNKHKSVAIAFRTILRRQEWIVVHFSLALCRSRSLPWLRRLRTHKPHRTFLPTQFKWSFPSPPVEQPTPLHACSRSILASSLGC